MRLSLSWPFFFLLKRSFTITINYSRTEHRTTITVGVTADSTVTPTVIVVAVIVVAVVLQYFLCMIVMFLIFISCCHHSVLH